MKRRVMVTVYETKQPNGQRGFQAETTNMTDLAIAAFTLARLIEHGPPSIPSEVRQAAAVFRATISEHDPPTEWRREVAEEPPP